MTRSSPLVFAAVLALAACGSGAHQGIAGATTGAGGATGGAGGATASAGGASPGAGGAAGGAGGATTGAGGATTCPGGAGGAAAAIPCGAQTCAPDEYCFAPCSGIDAGMDLHECRPIPAGCACGVVDCACTGDPCAPTSTCSAMPGERTIACTLCA